MRLYPDDQVHPNRFYAKCTLILAHYYHPKTIVIGNFGYI